MLFVALLKAKAGTAVERTTRRMEWQYPDGVQVVAEYWLQTPDPNCITIFEAESIASMMAATAPWDDVFEITIVPAIRAEDGIEIAKQMIQR